MNILLDNLTLPKIVCGKTSGVCNPQIYTSRIIKEYGGLLNNNNKAQKVLDSISSDPRVQSLEVNKYRFTMNQRSKTPEDPEEMDIWFPKNLSEQFTIWFLWRAGEVGVEQTNHELNQFLDCETIETLSVIWLIGPRMTENVIHIRDGYELRSVESMPDSNEKDAYSCNIWDESDHNRSDGIQQLLMPYKAILPNSAVVHRVSLSKHVSGAPNEVNCLVESNRRLTTISLLLNLLDNISVYPSWHTYYLEPNIPFGPLSHTGSSLSPPKIVLSNRGTISQTDASPMNQLLEKYDELSSESRDVLKTVLSRFRNAKFMSSDINGFLDLSIVLESTLLYGEGQSNEKAKRFRNNGCRLLGVQPGQNSNVWRQLFNLYDIGSRIRHEGVIKLENLGRINTQEDLDRFVSPKNFFELCRLTSRILRELLTSPQSQLR